MEWKQIKPDFSSSNNSMQNAMSGLSSAGTVFEKMREGILAEEQRAIENARAADAAALAQAELDERIRANQADEAHAAATLAEQMRHAKATEAAAATGLKLQQDAVALNRANIEAGTKAADILYEMQHGAQGVNNALAALKAAEAMTPEMFEEAKLSGGMINPDTKQAYADVDEYRKALGVNYDKLNADFALKYPKLGSAGFEDLSTSTGLERQFGRIFRQLGGTGLGTEYLPNYISRGVATESELAKADAVAKVEAAKNARLSELEYGSWDKINGILTKSGFGAVDAQAIGSTILGVQRALKSAGMNVSNKEVFNRIMETASLPNDKKGIIGKGWDWLWGGDRASLGKYGMNNAVGDFTKLWGESGTTDSKKTPDAAPTKIDDLTPEQQTEARDWLRKQQLTAEANEQSFDPVTAEQQIVNQINEQDHKYVSLFIQDVPALLKKYTNEELKTLGLTKKSATLTKAQLNKLKKINSAAVREALPFYAWTEFERLFQ